MLSGAMMSSQPNIYMSPKEYLALERTADFKSEYFDGEIFALAGGSENHNLIATNITGLIHYHLRRGLCKVFNSDMKVRIFTAKKYVYPDATVVCGERKFDDEYKDAVLNPVLLVEVLSDSTAAYDRGGKFQAYKQLESFKEYILVSQDEYVIEQYVRKDEHNWSYTDAVGKESSIYSPTIDCTLSLSDVYEKTT
ncbi:MAG: Uma2 family endonuclease [Pyrinomonadaceae bacterium]